jgi:hypothetical protein
VFCFLVVELCCGNVNVGTKMLSVSSSHHRPKIARSGECMRGEFCVCADVQCHVMKSISPQLTSEALQKLTHTSLIL